MIQKYHLLITLCVLSSSLFACEEGDPATTPPVIAGEMAGEVAGAAGAGALLAAWVRAGPLNRSAMAKPRYLEALSSVSLEDLLVQTAKGPFVRISDSAELVVSGGFCDKTFMGLTQASS